MAKLPDITARRPVGRSYRAISTDRSGQMVARAVGELGSSVAGFGNTLQERENRFEYAMAKAQLFREDARIRRDLASDPDWSTYGTRYREQFQSAADKAGALIGSSNDRGIFEQDAMMSLERGFADMQSVARERQIERGMAGLAQSLQSNRETALASDPATQTEIIQSTYDLIRAAHEAFPEAVGVDDAQEMRQSWIRDVATGYAENMSASARVAYLGSDSNNSMADFIDPVVRSKMLASAQDELRETELLAESQQRADTILGQYETRGEALAAARELKDPDLREATVKEVTNQLNERENARREKHLDVLDRASDLVEQSGRTSSIPRSDWLELSLSERSAIEARARQLSSGEEPETDLARWYELQQMSVDDPQAFANHHLMLDRHLLSKANFQELARAQTAIKSGTQDADKLLNGWRTANQIVQETLPTTVKDDDRNEFRRQVDERVIALQTQTGREATTDEIQAIADELAVQMSRKIPFWRDPKLYRFQVESEGLEGFEVTDITQVPRADRQAIEIVLRSRGAPATDDAILSLYNRNLGQ